MGEFREATPEEAKLFAGQVGLGLHVMPYAFTVRDKRTIGWLDVHAFLTELCGNNRSRSPHPGNEDYWPVWIHCAVESWRVVIFFRRADHATAFKLRWV